MKKIISGLLAACLLTGSLLGCNKKLDVEPADSIDAGLAFGSSSDVQAALVGCYTGLQNVQVYGGYIQLMSDLLADNGDISFNGTFSQPQEIQRKTILKDNSFITTIWTNSYNVINRANGVLANVKKLDTPGKQARGEGEAKFIRSLVYFDLVRLYARAWNDGSPQTNPGVPLVLTPTLGVTAASQVSRNTVAEVYTQVIADLVSAESLLPADNGFFANKYSAAALLARIYLQQGRFADAASAANRVIDGGVPADLSLNSSYAANFKSTGDLLSNTREDIFAIQVSAQSGRNELNTFYSTKRRGDITIESQFLNLFEPTDDRKSLFSQSSPTADVFSTKYDVLYGNLKLFRLAEMYLIRAEGNSRSGTAQLGRNTPLADINTVRTRALLPPLTTLTQAAILKERRLELAFEGFRLGDLKRNQQSTIDPVTNAVIAWNSTRLVFPIPLREINANSNLTQNAGY